MNFEALVKLQNILFNAKVHFRLWEELQKRRTEKHVNVINAGFSTFIIYTIQAHFKSLIVELHKLVEKRKDTYNLTSFIENAKIDPDASLKLVEECNDYLDKTKLTSKAIFILRNEVEAHSTMKRAPEESFNAAAITPRDINKFIQSSGYILNAIGSHFFQQKWTLNEIEEGKSVTKLYEAMEAYTVA